MPHLIGLLVTAAAVMDSHRVRSGPPTQKTLCGFSLRLKAKSILAAVQVTWTLLSV